MVHILKVEQLKRTVKGLQDQTKSLKKLEFRLTEQRPQNVKVIVYFNTKIGQTDQTLTFKKATVNGFSSSAISLKEEK